MNEIDDDLPETLWLNELLKDEIDPNNTYDDSQTPAEPNNKIFSAF